MGNYCGNTTLMQRLRLPKVVGLVSDSALYPTLDSLCSVLTQGNKNSDKTANKGFSWNRELLLNNTSINIPVPGHDLRTKRSRVRFLVLPQF